MIDDLGLSLEKTGELKVLDFDVEARPLSWITSDYVSKEITAIGCQWIEKKGKGKSACWLLGVHDPVEMLESFRQFYDKADMVVGHYIRGYDLPTVMGAMTDFHLDPITSKLTHDTKQDLVKWQGHSKSQENIGAMLGIDNPKVHMNQEMWREANRLTPEGVKLTRERVLGDVKQNIEMRARLLELGYLGPPQVWEYSQHGYGQYKP